VNQETNGFTEELAALKERLFQMGQIAEDRLRLGLAALVARDVQSLAGVISGDARLQKLQSEIDHRCLTLLALNQPVAADLRTIVSIFKINGDLERAGELAVRIGQAAQRYLSHPPVKPLVDLPRMGELSLRMLREALHALVSRNVPLAHRVLRLDDWLDALKNQILRELITYMLGDPHTIEPAIDLIVISRHLERVGDHATNIAEDVIFIVEARDVRHRFGPVAIERRRGLGVAPV
jgi:phosphate transport system protein